MSTLCHQDLAWALRTCPKAVLAELRSRPSQLFLAGGYIRDSITREKPHDLDLFAPSAELAEAAARSIAAYDDRHLPLIRTDNAWTICHPSLHIQVIHRWTFDTPVACIASFDFTIACAAIYYGRVPADDGAPEGLDWISVCDPSFYSDLAGRRLVYRNPLRNEDAGGSILRVLKFYQRGYRIPLQSLADVVVRLLSGVHSLPHLASQPAELSKVIHGLLREVYPNTNPDHLGHIPDALLP